MSSHNRNSPSLPVAAAYILTCLFAPAAGTNDVQVFTSVNTNTQPGVFITLEAFTRAGETNLVRDTRIKDGAMAIRNQTFYHQGSRIGGYITHPNSSLSFSVAGAPYSMSFQCDASNHLRSALIVSNSTILEAFACTNGMFFPHNSAFIERAASYTTTLSD